LVLHALRRHRTPRSLRVFFTAPATTELHPLSLHDALPIFIPPPPGYRVVTREYIFHSARQEIFLIIRGQKKLSTPQHSRFLHKSKPTNSPELTFCRQPFMVEESLRDLYDSRYTFCCHHRSFPRHWSRICESFGGSGV